jgi:hypothetical protein
MKIRHELVLETAGGEADTTTDPQAQFLRTLTKKRPHGHKYVTHTGTMDC